jgi:NADH:ubiquinone oxidoreductase subunit 5 (subunit L)/multisubunit Na+/H+ antiporter MnhA subunit
MDENEQPRQPQQSREPSGGAARDLLSVIVVGGFVLPVGIIVVFVNMGTVETELVSDVATVYSGITGAMIGYYFGRS